MLLYLSLVGIFLSVLLLYFNARRNASTVYLGIFFLLVSLYGINQYILLESGSVFLISILATNITFLHYLIGPMLYWYIRSVLTDSSKLKIRDLFHLLPMLVYLIAALPYMFSSYSFKVEIAKAIVEDLGVLSRYNFTFLSEIFSNTIIYLSRPVLILAYTLGSIILYIKYVIFRKGLMVFPKQSFMTKWLSALLVFQLMLIISYLISLFLTFVNSSDVLFTVNYLQILSAVGLIGLLISPFFFPGILYGMPRLPANAILLPEAEETDPLQFREKKTIHYFESEYIQTIEQKADSCMLELQPFLQPDLNMAQFAYTIQIPVHHLAYYFREVKKQSFSDYRNKWRIENAKKLISEGKASGITLEAIGLQSGFTTRNTFLTAFKRAEGISPNTFLMQISK
ncbi:MAG: helix-turn-helix domain-containing protein [Bacteroidales bacterium]|nr:helix-turn-helix domain-containing protein [Bacteroidales bacterium]